MDITKYSQLNFRILAVVICLSCSWQYLNAAAGGGISSAEEGLQKMRTWIQTPEHNKYGREIERMAIIGFEGNFKAINPVVVAFRENLKRELANNEEFKSIMLQRTTTGRELGVNIFLQTIRVASGALGTYLVYNTDSLDYGSKVVSFGVSGLALAESTFSLGTSLLDVYKSCSRSVPSPKDILAEADKISLYLAFKKYREIIVRPNEIDIVVAEYIDRVLGALARHYRPNSRKALVSTILTAMG